MAELFCKSEDSDQMPHSAASDLDLHCLPLTLLGDPDYNELKSMDTISGEATLSKLFLFSFP